MRHRRFGAIGCAAVLAVAGCSVGPEYHRPPPLAAGAEPARFEEETKGLQWRSADPTDAKAAGDWWKAFGNPALDRIITGVLAANLSVSAAGAHYEAARAATDVARSAAFPEIDASPSFNRQRASANAPQLGKPARTPYTYNTAILGLQAGWELDLWGRVRRQVEGARASQQAAVADLAGVRLAVAAEAAADFFSLRGLDIQRRILEETVKADRRALELVQNRRQGGVGTDLDVAQAETQLRSVEAQIPAIDLDRSRLRHALTALAGGSGSALSDAPLETTLPDPTLFGGGQPSVLLQRRPDVAAAENRMKAANAAIGVAKAAYFPAFRIGGVAGLESVSVDSLLNSPSRFWSVGPSVTFPLFTGGRIAAGVRVAKAGYDEALADYRSSVVRAVQEVEDALAAQRLLEEEETTLRKAVDAARRTLEIASNRYRAGLVTYLEVATAQTTALDFERRAVQVQADRWLAAVAMIKALGGGSSETQRQ